MRVAAAIICGGLLLAWPAAAAEPASWPGAETSTASDSRFYLLSFSDAPAAEVAEAVLGGALGLPFTVEPEVEATVSFEVADSLTREQLLARFETALAAEGLRVEHAGDAMVVTARPTPPPEPALAEPTVPAPPVAAPPPRPPDPVTRPWWPWLAIGGGLALLALAAVWWVGRRPPAPPHEAGGDGLKAAAALCGVSGEAVAEARMTEGLTGTSAAAVLVERGLTTEAALAEAFTRLSGCPRWGPEARPAIDLSAGEPALARRLTRLRLVPVGWGRELTVATDDPMSDSAALSLAAELNRPVRLLTATPSEIDAALGAEGARLLARTLAEPHSM